MQTRKDVTSSKWTLRQLQEDFANYKTTDMRDLVCSSQSASHVVDVRYRSVWYGMVWYGSNSQEELLRHPFLGFFDIRH
eukprot:6195170-Pleurochrysis_carterae.AAC.12